MSKLVSELTPEYLQFWDVETTGIPDYKKPSDAPHQPHIVEYACKLMSEQGDEIRNIHYIVRPDGWVIPQETIDIHGITQEQAMDEGVSEKQVLEMHLELCESNKRIAYNQAFDDRLMRIAMKRYYSPEKFDIHGERYKNLKKECCLSKARKWKKYSKTPKMIQVYSDLFDGAVLENAHTAMGDVNAMIRIYFELQKLGG